MIMDCLDEVVDSNKTEIIIYQAIAGKELQKNDLHRKLKRMFHGENPEERLDSYLISKFAETFHPVVNSEEVDEFLDGLKKYPNLSDTSKARVKERLKKVYFSAYEDFILIASNPCLMPPRGYA